MTGSAGGTAAVPNEVFRDVIGRFATGVTVITTTVAGVDHGTTASAVSSLSLEPPMLLVCLNRTSDTQDAVLRSGVFGVNVLAEDQGEIAYRFAKKGADKFDGVGVRHGTTGVPLIEHALAHLECEVQETVPGGTHTVFLARVHRVAGSGGAPLTYFRGRFGRLESALDADSYVVTPVTADAAGQLFDARCTVEIGVAEETVGSAGSEALDGLEALADQLARIVRSDAPDLSDFLRTSHAFHRQLVALAGSPQLSESYERLGIPALWTRTMSERSWWRDVDVVHYADLVRAYRAGDLAEAKRLIRQHRQQAKQLVRGLLPAAGEKV
jgi:flavin reductase (DIM6/NTAB) family NADH-FMN oxidoreductase RutF